MPALEFFPPFLGINLQADPRTLLPAEAEDCLNVDLDDGLIAHRPVLSNVFDFSLNGPILGFHVYRKSTGFVTNLIKAANTLKSVVFGGAGFIITDLATDLVPDEPACFLTVNNRAYFLDGDILRVTDSVAVFPAIITAPTVAITVADAGAAGRLKGAYDYKYTYYSSTWGQESAASPVSNNLELRESQANLSGFVVTGIADSRVDKVRIYRRNTQTFEPTWSLAHEVLLTEPTLQTQFVDNVADNDVDVTVSSPPSTTFVLTGARFMAYQADVTFIAGQPSAPTRLYFTRAGQPFCILNFLEIGSGNDSDPITGLLAIQGTLWVFKERSIWTVTGNSPESFFVRKVFVGIGCRSHFSIVEREGLMYWLAEDGFYFTDGSAQPRKLSLCLEPRILERDADRDRFAVGFDDDDHGCILWAVTTPGQDRNAKQYAFFYRNTARLGKPSWSPWALSSAPYALGSFMGPTAGYQRFLGLANGKVAMFITTGTRDDDQAPFTFLWRSGRQTGGDPDRFKAWGEIVAHIDNPSAIDSAPLLSSMISAYRLDGEPTSTVMESHIIDDETFRGRVNRSSREVRLEFSESAGNQFSGRLCSFYLRYKMRGRA